MPFNEFGHLICGDEIPSVLGIFDFSTAHPLLFYSYIPIVIISLLIGIGIYKKDRTLRGGLLLLMVSFFSLWVLNIIVQWIASYHTVLMFGWELTALFEVGFFLSAFYLAYVFVQKRDFHWVVGALVSLIFLAVAFLLPSSLNISSYDPNSCEGVVGPLWNWIYVLEPLVIFAIIYNGIIGFKKEPDRSQRKQIVVFTLGLAILLSTFFLSNFYGELTKVYEFNLWGPIGMLFFFVLLAYLIVRFHTFNVKLFATQGLVLFNIVLVGSRLFYRTNFTDLVLSSVTLVFFIISGAFLIRSVKREIKQKEQLQVLTLDLKRSNETLKGLDKLKTEFLSLASHQLRSPLTAIKGYASMLDEGAFGKLTEEQSGAAKRIYASAQGLVNLVEDLLNVSKIEQGGMQYEFMPTDLSKLVQDLGGEIRIPVENKKLELKISIPKNDRFMVSADPMKIRQVFLNLVDNSVKYTQQGYVEIGLKRDTEKNIVFYVRDTGVGITPETKQKLFDKFSRGEAGKLNTGGSGLGLYLAQEIAKAHKGNVDVISEGVGKGSLFTVTLPAVASQKDGSYITT